MKRNPIVTCTWVPREWHWTNKGETRFASCSGFVFMRKKVVSHGLEKVNVSDGESGVSAWVTEGRGSKEGKCIV